jgi:hypothetical protein
MTAPGTPEGGVAPLGPTDIELDDMEKALAEPAPPKLDDVKFDGDQVPEELKGKTATEVVAYMGQLKASLLTSEQARLQAQEMAKMSKRIDSQVAPPPPPPADEPEISEDDLAQLMQDDPVKAAKLISDQAIKKAAAQYDERIASLSFGAASVAEQAAKAEFATEFELFGDDIEDMIKQIPGGRQALTSSKNWNDLVSLIRGRTHNIKKLRDHWMTQEKGESKVKETVAHQEAIGFSPTPTTGAPLVAAVPGGVDQMDATTREIAKNLGMSPEDYITWSKMG